MYREIKDGDVLSLDHVIHVLRSKFPHANMREILGYRSEYDEKREVFANECGR